MKSYRWIIKGKVQGVGYRNFCFKKATSLGLKGTVQNLKSGDVQLDIEGEEGPIIELRKWCQKGPLFARVKMIEEFESEPRHFEAFLILD